MSIKTSYSGRFKPISLKHALLGLVWVFKSILNAFQPPRSRTKIRVSKGDIQIEVS